MTVPRASSAACLLSVTLWGCGAPPVATSTSSSPSVISSTEPASSTSNAADAGVETGETIDAGSVEAAAADTSPSVFPPRPIPPPFPRTAQDRDGLWSPLEGAQEGSPHVLVRTTLHPHPVKRFTYMAVVAADLDHLTLKLVAGTQEPESKDVEPKDRPGLVPRQDLDKLVAVFNGGFQARHGSYGMAVLGKSFLPPIQDACTIVLGQDDSVRIGTFSKLGLGQGALTYRQTPPCLVEHGIVNEGTRGEWTGRRWGNSIEGKIEIRRTALGIDSTGRILFFGLGEEITAGALADGMKAVGAVDAAELDINWSYTRFLFYQHLEGAKNPEMVSTLIPKIKYTPGGYVEKPASRDFFYLKKK